MVIVAGALLPAPAALADHWPMAGGNPSRSSKAVAEGGHPPITHGWGAPDGRVRTPIVVTGGGSADRQRVAYGTANGFFHLRSLETGAPVGPPEGIDIDGGSINDDGAVFGSGGNSVGFADTSTEDRLGQLFVVHNDDPVAAAAVFIARFDAASGEKVSEEVVPNTAQCSINASPLLTPPGPGGSRLLYFVLVCPLYRHLVRVPIAGDATTRDAVVGAPGFATIPDATETAAPTLVVLRDAAGVPRFHVAVARRAGLSLFPADAAFEATPGNTATPAAITAELDDPTAVPQTPAAPATDAGLVAGGERSGTGPAPAIYVAARVGEDTRVHRLVQDGNSPVLRLDRAVSLPGSGAPAAAMAVDELVTPSGLSEAGTLVVTSAANATLLRAGDLSVAGRLSSSPLPPGSGFARTAAAVSGDFAYLVRDGDAATPAEHLVLRLDGLAPVGPPAFDRVADPAPGPVAGQPAFSSGRVVFGTGRGPLAYVTREADAPDPDDKVVELPPAACAEELGGSRGRDRIQGTRGGDRILGGAGDDRIDGGAGADCLYGQNGRDRLMGGSGNDLLEGGSGSDVLTGGGGRNQLNGGSGNDRLRGGPLPDRIRAGGGDDRIAAVDRRRDAIVCGKGRDRVTADRADRVHRSCERVTRVRLRRR